LEEELAADLLKAKPRWSIGLQKEKWLERWGAMESVDALLGELTALYDKYAEAIAAKQNSNQAKRRWMKGAATRDLHITELKTKIAKAVWTKKVGEFYCKLTDVGGLSLAIRRVISSAASVGFGLCIGMDIHRTTICYWERRLRAALLAAYRAWALANYMAMEALQLADPGLRIIIHGVRGDATNAKLWQECKVHVVWCECGFSLEEIIATTSMEAIREGMDRKDILAELQVLDKKDPTTPPGLHLLGCIEKQLESCGMRLSWKMGDNLQSILDQLELGEAQILTSLFDEPGHGPEPSTEIAKAADDSASASAPGLLPVIPRHKLSEAVTLRAWPVTTDDGSDEKASRERINSALAALPHDASSIVDASSTGTTAAPAEYFTQ
jgi:hypothetical protein